MSLRPTFGNVDGFLQQHRTFALAPLNMLVNSSPPDHAFLQELVSLIRPRRGLRAAQFMKHPRTTDGYVWFGGIGGEYARGTVVLLLPYQRDDDCKDGVYLDRSVALFATERVQAKQAETFTRNVFVLYEHLVQQRPKESLLSAGRF